MIKWCSYCQKFLGEIEPLDNYALTHGICLACKAKGSENLENEMDAIKRLAAFQKRLMEAGAKQDKAMAREIIAEARHGGVQDVDLLIGIISPILWEVGALWSKDIITVADEHRFTAFYNDIMNEMKFKDLVPAKTEETRSESDILLVNAPQNYHLLGVHILNLWLHSQKIYSSILLPDYSTESLLKCIHERQPRFVGFSVALSEQIPATLQLCAEIRREYGSKAPTLLIGGSAIKRGAALEDQSVTPLHDINELLGILQKGIYSA